MMYLCGKYKYGEKKLELNGREEEIEGGKGVMIYEARGMWGTKERKKKKKKKKKSPEEVKKIANVRDLGAERRTKKKQSNRPDKDVMYQCTM
jgi:hypothetical protein